MSDELFEVAFSGLVSDASDIDNVKARVGKMFNADAAKIVQLFSGKRMVIKKNIDRATAEKYQNAFAKAGAIAEVKSMAATSPVDTSPAASAPVASQSASQPASQPAKEPVKKQPAQAATAATADDDELTPPKTDPLGITGDQIADLGATIAPVGSTMQDQPEDVAPPSYDLSGLDVAPVGSQIGPSKKAADPPPPDTAGLSMAD